MSLEKRDEDEEKEVRGIHIELRSQKEEDVLSLRLERGTRIQLSLEMQVSAADNREHAWLRVIYTHHMHCARQLAFEH